VIAASSFLAAEARALGAERVEVVPAGVELPEHVGEPAEPPHVLYAGRLSEEKGILEFLEATEGVPRVIVGDGPLRDRVPEATGFVAPGALGSYYARAAVVAVPSRREGYGMTAREALAHARPVVASRVGGLADLEDGVVFVEPNEPAALGAQIRALLEDPARRLQLAEEGRRAAAASFGRDEAARRLLAVYSSAVGA
jgi:glycosyltransferase involved in cell wall biosynthesis